MLFLLAGCSVLSLVFPQTAGVYVIKIIIIIPLDSPLFDDVTRQDDQDETVDNFVNQVRRYRRACSSDSVPIQS